MSIGGSKDERMCQTIKDVLFGFAKRTGSFGPIRRSTVIRVTPGAFPESPTTTKTQHKFDSPSATKIQILRHTLCD